MKKIWTNWTMKPPRQVAAVERGFELTKGYKRAHWIPKDSWGKQKYQNYICLGTDVKVVGDAGGREHLSQKRDLDAYDQRPECSEQPLYIHSCRWSAPFVWKFMEIPFTTNRRIVPPKNAFKIEKQKKNDLKMLLKYTFFEMNPQMLKHLAVVFMTDPRFPPVKAHIFSHLLPTQDRLVTEESMHSPWSHISSMNQGR